MISRILIILLIASTVYADDRSDALNRANTFGKSLSDTYSDRNNIKNKLYNPLTADTKMETLSGAWKCPDKATPFETQAECNTVCSSTCSVYTFDAALQCSSSTQAVTVSPYTFTTGGEVALKIQYDTDLDGTIDTSFSTSNISGFCTNGYVSCTPGTFQNCKYYEFGIKHKCDGSGAEFNTYRECDAACSGVCKPSDNKTLAFQRNVTDMRYSGGCFCSNASCGSSFNTVFQNALSYFGGALTAHMMKELGLALTDTSIDTSTLSVKYYAASPSSCLAVSDDKTDQLKSYYQQGTIDYDNELISQSSDPDSLYNTVTAPQTSTAKTNLCTITNTPIVETGSTAEYWCTPGEVITRAIHRTGYSDRQLTQNYQCVDNDGDGRGETIRFRLDCAAQGESYSRCDSSSSNGWKLILLNSYSGGNQNSGAAVNVHWGSDGGTDTAQLFYSVSCSESICQLAHYVDVGRYGTANDSLTTQMLVITRDETLSVARNDSCSAFSNDSNCRMESESVNDIDTVVNYVKTGTNPQNVCRTIYGSSSTFIICDYGDEFGVISSVTAGFKDDTYRIISAKHDGLEWYSIERTYVCQTNSSYDFSDARKQADLVGSTLDKDSGDFSYYSENGISAGNAKIDLSSYETCSYTCTVQTGNQDTTLFPDQTTRNDTSTVTKEQRPCGSEKICPYDSSSETLISDCTCTSSFNEVISLFSTLNDAVRDMICSNTSK